MNELGFIIDRNGKISFFGEWVKYRLAKEKRDRKNKHSYSFEDDIESTDYFQSLGLEYDKNLGKDTDIWMRSASFRFAVQGIIIGFNIGVYFYNEFLAMYVPKNLTYLQKESLLNLYATLNGFETIQIQVVSDIEEKLYNALDEYFEDYQINRENNLGRQ